MTNEELVATVQAEFTTLEERYQKRNSTFDRMEEMYQLYVADEAQLQESYHLINDPTPHDAVELSLGLAGIPGMKIEVPPKSNLEDNRKNADKMEKALRGIWYATERRARRPTRRMLLFNLFLKGWACAQVMWDGKAEKADKLPIKIRLVDPREVYPRFVDDELDCVIHAYTTTVREFKARYPNAKLHKLIEKESHTKQNEYERVLREDTERVRVIDKWTTEHNVLVVEDEVANSSSGEKYGETIKAGKRTHNYGFIPFSIGFGRTTPINDGEMEALSILFSYESVWHYSCDLLSQLAIVIQKAAWPSRFIKSDRGDVDLSQDADFATVIKTDEMVFDLPPTGDIPIVRSQLAWVEGAQARSLYPGSLYGIYAGEPPAGYLISQLHSAANAKMEPVLRGAEWMLSEINEFILRLVANTKFGGAKGVSIWGEDESGKKSELTLTSKEIGDHYINYVTLKPRMPQDEMQRVQMASQLTSGDKPMVSQHTARDQILSDIIKSATDEEAKVAEEMIKFHPAMMDATAQAKAEEMGLDLTPFLEATGKSPEQTRAGPPVAPREGQLPPTMAPGQAAPARPVSQAGSPPQAGTESPTGPPLSEEAVSRARLAKMGLRHAAR